ncbi:MAG: O-antigen ligase family protein [Egibacteraceae bacterium]
MILVTTALALVAAKAPVLAVLAAAGGVLVVALAFSPDLATMAVVALLYSNAAVLAVRFHGVPGFVGAAVPFLLLIPLANAILAERRPVVLPSALPWLLGFLAVQVVSALLASDTQTAWESVTQFLFEGLALFFVVSNIVRTPQLLQRLVWVLLLVGATLGLLSTHQSLTKSYDQNYLGFAQADTVAAQELANQVGVVLPPDSRPPRQGGPLGEPNRYAQIMAALLPLGVLQLVKGRSALVRLAALSATALIAVAIAFTFSRGAAVGIALSIVAAVLLRYVRLREIAVLVITFAAFVLAVPGYAERLQSIATVTGALTDDPSRGTADGAIQGRLGEQAAAVKIFADHPLVGIGPGLYAQNYRDYAQGSGFRVHLGPRQAHNLLLDIASETGILGLACFLGAIVVTVRDLSRARRRLLTADPELAALVTSIALGILVYLGTSLFLQLSYVRYFWLWLALGAAASTLTPRTPAVEG